MHFVEKEPSQKRIDFVDKLKSNKEKYKTRNFLVHFVEKEPNQKRADFVSKLKSNKILRVPGAYNPLTAKLIEEIGYDAVYVSGGVMANDLGFPDIGLTTLQDVSTRSYLISRVTSLPTIVDIDTGFKSCEETIKTFEEFGVSAVHLEDQVERKRCGHLDNKELISTEAMVKKISEQLDRADAHPYGARPFKRQNYINKFLTLTNGILNKKESDRFLKTVQNLKHKDQEIGRAHV